MKILYLSSDLLTLWLISGCSENPVNLQEQNSTENITCTVVRKPTPPPPPSPPLDLFPTTNNIDVTTMTGIVVCNYSNNFITSRWYKNSSTNSYRGVVIGNIDGHPEPELVTISRFSSEKTTVPSNLVLEVNEHGSTGIPSAKYSILPQAYTSVWDLTLKDADNDGLNEILVLGKSSIQIWKYDQTQNKLVRKWEHVFPQAYNEFPREADIGDAEIDGMDELLFSSWSRGLFSVYNNAGDNQWGTDIASPALPSRMLCIIVGDVDNDVANEIVCSSNEDNLSIFRYEGGQYILKYSGAPLGEASSSITISDFDGDGLNEIAAGLLTSVTLMDKLFVFNCTKTETSYSLTQKFSMAMTMEFSDMQVANIDDDPNMEIVACGNSNLVVFDFFNNTYRKSFYSASAEVNDILVK
ncbi:MAG: hypothetical protein FMNOHCHN_02270 [Ignavibacteriaceae bacterium]|nr:hypothetical protein [Ignavibacteriaceae bacterium]